MYHLEEYNFNCVKQEFHISQYQRNFEHWNNRSHSHFHPVLYVLEYFNCYICLILFLDRFLDENSKYEFTYAPLCVWIPLYNEGEQDSEEGG